MSQQDCTQNNCPEKVDLECVIYHYDNLKPSKLINLNLKNGSSVRSIFEMIDATLGALPYNPLSVTNTEGISVLLDGPGNKHISASIVLSQKSGNTAEILSDGIYVPTPPDIYKVQVTPFSTPYYLEDALIGGTDNIVSLFFEQLNGILIGKPSINTSSFVSSLTEDSSSILNLTSSVVNSLINNSTFLNSLATLEKTAILNNSNAIANIANAVVNNPSAMGDLCNAINNCPSGTTVCPDPYIIASAVGVESTGGTVVLTINYADSVPPAPSGYTLVYREKGTSSYTTYGPVSSSPIQIFGLPIGDYEGFLKSNCLNGVESSGATWLATLPCNDSVADGYILGNNCNGVPTILYTRGAFAIGAILYTDAGLTTHLSGYNSVVYAGYIYTVDSTTGQVLSQASLCSPPPFTNIVLKNYTNNGISGTQYSFSFVENTFGGSSQTMIGGITSVWSSLTPVVAGAIRQGTYSPKPSAQISIAFSNDTGNQFSGVGAYLYVNNVRLDCQAKVASSGIITFSPILDLTDNSQVITIILTNAPGSTCYS